MAPAASGDSKLRAKLANPRFTSVRRLPLARRDLVGSGSCSHTASKAATSNASTRALAGRRCPRATAFATIAPARQGTCMVSSSPPSLTVTGVAGSSKAKRVPGASKTSCLPIRGGSRRLAPGGMRRSTLVPSARIKRKGSSWERNPDAISRPGTALTFSGARTERSPRSTSTVGLMRASDRDEPTQALTIHPPSISQAGTPLTAFTASPRARNPISSAGLVGSSTRTRVTGPTVS